ncbi:type II secretion system protein [Gemmiger sp.]|uniref:type II secretion system protein n=1 Tax=Gemmiger sp. TaxID=2049027 RepID=UPI00266CE617|nr:type II secretion system protein [uncultured Gemmiger sp.]
MRKKLQNKRGFTLVELIVVLTILGVLAAMLIPALQGYIEKALETSDIVNVRAAYMQVLSDAMTGDVTAEQTVQLKQGQDGWQRFDPVTIAGITHAADEGDTDNWKGSPTAHGTCRVSYVEGTGVVLTWSGEGTKPSQPARPTVDLSENLHGILKNSGLLETDLKDFTARGKFYEIDSSCPNSTMVPKVQAQIGKNSLLSTGTWDFRKISGEDPGRYLFWTSVDVTKFAVGTEVPVLVSKEDGGMFYITTMPVTTSTLKNQTYNVIGKGITNRGTLNPYIQGTEYTTLEEAYAAYADMVKNGYSQYADTLPK